MQTRQVSAAKDLVPRSIFSTRLVNERRIGPHAIALSIRRGGAVLVGATGQRRRGSAKTLQVPLCQRSNYPPWIQMTAEENLGAQVVPQAGEDALIEKGGADSHLTVPIR